LEVVIVVHDELQIQNTNIQKDQIWPTASQVTLHSFSSISANFSFFSRFQTGSQGNMISMAG